jgi:lactate dehydrogenase-like 2-hydroxyacid dehydrogenase
VTNVLVLDSLFDSLDVEEDAAREAGASLARWDGAFETLAEADVVAHVRTRVDAALISRMPRCRVISRFGSGIDTVDLDAADAAGIAVVTVRDYCVRELATHTLALAFSLVRRLAVIGGSVDSTWDDVAAATPLHDYASATVIGLGTVGKVVARGLVAIGYDVHVATRHAVDEARELGAEPVELDEGLALADLVFLHSALDASTTRMIDARRLETMRPRAILVNTARLGLLDELAVTAALEAGALGGLALDASLSPSSPLRRLVGDPPHRRRGFAERESRTRSRPSPRRRAHGSSSDDRFPGFRRARHGRRVRDRAGSRRAARA